MASIQRAAVIGLGLVGGSMAMALTQGRVVDKVIGMDKNPRTLSLAINTKAADEVTQSIEEAVAGCDLVILATPISTMPEIAKKILPNLKPGSLVTDVGSTKERLVEQLEAVLQPKANYIGGHPMAGSEKGGLQAADRYLFENAVYLLTPTDNSDPEALKSLQSLLQKVGARVLTMSREEHDRTVAAVSHLPHLVASALVNSVGNKPEMLQFAAGGFRDTTRVASGDPVLWRDIVAQNSSRVMEVLTQFQEQLAVLRKYLEDKNFTALEHHLTNASSLRQQIPSKQKGFLPALYEVAVTVPDRPGMIGEMAIILGRHKINIIDIEILRVREGDGGTIRLGFQKPEVAREAVNILRDKGIIAKEL